MEGLRSQRKSRALILACRLVLQAVCGLVLLAVAAFPAVAQQWQASLSDDGVYRTAEVRYPGLGLSLRCHARSAGGGQVIDSIWFESTIPPPDRFLIEFSSQLVPIGQDSRSDLIVFVGQTGFRLPPVRLNELSGTIETQLSGSDAMFAALPRAARLVLQVGSTQAWELPLTGMADAVAQARRYCTTPAASPAPAPPAAGFALPPQVQAHVNGECGGFGRIAPDTVQAGDLDGDSVPDVVLDWGGVLCPGETRSGYCGAANCQIDLFLSSRGYAVAHSTLAVGARIVAHRSGRLGLLMGGTASVCGSIDCSVPWLWNGADLVQVP